MIWRKILRIIVGVYVLSFLLLCIFQRSSLYYPNHTYVSPHDAYASRSFREISVRTEDGLNLIDWYAPATTRPFTFVFFHGNGDSLSTASEVADPYLAAGYGFLVVEYRGYSGLPGKPTESGLYADGRAAIKGLMAQGVKSENMILFGHSLGTGVATQMAEEFHVGGLMLLAPYLSIPKLAQHNYPIYPVEYVVLDRFENAGKIGKIHVPLLIVNGANDQLIPPSQGKLLYAMANEPKEFHSLPGRGHNDAFDDFAVIGLDWTGRLPAKN
jgi:fermentation-respiration switch protein FrsA (DUF1100 family)